MEEGWFFTWTPEELGNILNIAQLPLVSGWFGITAQGELEGRNVLYHPQQAIKLQKQQDELYLDNSDGIYFKTAHDGEKLLVRDKPAQDGVLPSGNSIAAYNLLRLYK